MENNDFYGKFPTVDDAAKSFMASKHFQSLSPSDRTTALDKMRTEYRIAHVNNKTPSKGSVDGHIEPAKQPPTPGAVPDEGPDLAGRIRNKALSATSPQGGMPGDYGIRGELHALSSLLPDDNAQAFIDAAMLGSMWDGIGEMGLATRLALPTVAGAAGGATSGGKDGRVSGAMYGGLKGGAEGLGGEALALPFRAAKGAYGWMTRGAKKIAMQSEDLANLSGWLQERFPKSVATIKDMADFAKTFRQGALVKHADGEVEATEKEVRDTLAKSQKPKPAPGAAKVLSPSAQDEEADAALNELRGGQSKEPTKGPFGKSKGTPLTDRMRAQGTESADAISQAGNKKVWWDSLDKDLQDTARRYGLGPKEDPLDAAVAGEQAPAGKSSSAAPDEAKIRKQLEVVRKATASAIEKGQGEKVIQGFMDRETELLNQLPQGGETPESRLAKMRQGAIGKTPEERTKFIIDEAGAPPKPVSSGPDYRTNRPIKLDTPDREPIVNPVHASHGPTISVQGMPQAVADKMEIPRNAKVEVPIDVALQNMHEIEDRGWDLSGHAIHTRRGAAARSLAMQMETYIGDQIAKTDGAVANKWLQGRVNQRTAKVLTKLFNNKEVIDESGHLAMDVVHNIARQGDMFADLEAAMGPDEAVRFLTNPKTGSGLFRGAPPTAIDVPGKGITGTISLHPGLPPHPRAWIHPPTAAKYVGLDNAPFNMGYGRAMTAALVLGPERFLQMVGDLAETGNITDPSNAR